MRDTLGGVSVIVVAFAHLILTGLLTVTVGSLAASSGAAAADTLCASEATSAGLGGTFLAFLANTATAIESRFPAGAGWSRPDGVTVTTDLSTFDAAIDTSAAGAYRPVDIVWIGAPDPATVATNATSCSNWTTASAGASGDVGYSSRSGTATYAAGGTSCNGPNHLYCFQK